MTEGHTGDNPEESGTKYGNLVPGDHWQEDEQPEPDEEQPAEVAAHVVRVHHKKDPEQPNGYQYEFRVTHGHRWSPIAIPVAKRRWAGNFWRKCGDLEGSDWPDLPLCVREQVAAVVADADAPIDLNPEEAEADG